MQRSDTEGERAGLPPLDTLDTLELLVWMNREDATVPVAVARQLERIATLVDQVVARLREGGRLHYFGAGTSGRMAVADASECPPTFGVPPETVQAHMAGGPEAVFRSREGAEDDSERGRQEAREANIGPHDAVVGLSASGRTPYVLGALEESRRLGALTAAVVCNPDSPLVRVAHIPVVVEVGPEILAGSTRLKAGTAQKLVLNMLSTAVFARLGHVYDRYMVRMRPVNDKLRRRALRILQRIAGAEEAEARRALEAAQGDIRAAALLLKGVPSTGEAARLLQEAGGNLRAAFRRLQEGG